MTESSPKPKKVSKKKPLSPFEIFRTLFQRSSERKIPLLLRNMGEGDDVFCLCSETEDEFLYGISSMAIQLIKITDPELKTQTDSFMNKLFGYTYDTPVLLNIRDQISELSKTNGETMDVDVQSNPGGAIWEVRTNARGIKRTIKYVQPVDSLFHFRMVKSWCDKYSPYLDHVPNEVYSAPYVRESSSDTHVLTTIAPPPKEHPLSRAITLPIRIVMTKGIDVIMTKFFGTLPNPEIKSEILVVPIDTATFQLIHRVEGAGWSMLLVRPNSVLFSQSTFLK